MSKQLSSTQKEELLNTLKVRFDKNVHRHKTVNWSALLKKLESNPKTLWSLNEMEKTGGEPDVVDYNKEKDEYTFFDCCKESPKERRSVCYDKEALESRKKFKPKTSAQAMAEEIGIELLTETQYKTIQSLGEFDTKTSSWLKTPDKIRALGGAIFGDFRFGQVFVYHNGAESYYSSRGFRGVLYI